jgi:hypothetical protein
VTATQIHSILQHPPHATPTHNTMCTRQHMRHPCVHANICDAGYHLPHIAITPTLLSTLSLTATHCCVAATLFVHVLCTAYALLCYHHTEDVRGIRSGAVHS